MEGERGPAWNPKVEGQPGLVRDRNLPETTSPPCRSLSTLCLSLLPMHQHCLTPDNLRACSGCSEAQLQTPGRKTLSGHTVTCLPWVQSPVVQSSRRLEVSRSPQWPVDVTCPSCLP